MSILQYCSVPLLALLTLGATGPNSDAAFVRAALQSGAAEVSRALAASNSTDTLVRQYGGEMTADHGLANQRLIALAAARGIDTSAGATPQPKSPLHPPDAIPYFRTEVAAHQKSLALFAREARNGADAALRAFAARQLPLLRAHLALARKDLSIETKRR